MSYLVASEIYRFPKIEKAIILQLEHMRAIPLMLPFCNSIRAVRIPLVSFGFYEPDAAISLETMSRIIGRF